MRPSFAFIQKGFQMSPIFYKRRQINISLELCIFSPSLHGQASQCCFSHTGPFCSFFIKLHYVLHSPLCPFIHFPKDVVIRGCQAQGMLSGPATIFVQPPHRLIPCCTSHLRGPRLHHCWFSPFEGVTSLVAKGIIWDDTRSLPWHLTLCKITTSRSESDLRH